MSTPSILITGGTGFIGRALLKRLVGETYQVIVLSRNRAKAQKRLPGIECIENLDEIAPERNIAAVVNLAGASIAGHLWTKHYKKTLRTSRIETTARLVAWVGSRTLRPEVLVSASAIGFYGNRGDETLTEGSSTGDDFGANLCRDWEAAAASLEHAGIRLVSLRIGLVLGLGGGVLQPLLIPLKLGLGAPMGDGRQWMSWIHLSDLIDLIVHAINHKTMAGIFNATAPEPATNETFMRTLGRVWHRPIMMRLPAWPLKLVLGEMSEIFLEGQKVLPERTLQTGFRFSYLTLLSALENIHG